MQSGCSRSVPSEQGVCEAVLQLLSKVLGDLYRLSSGKETPPCPYSFRAELKEVNLGFLSAEVEAQCFAV